ncbi:hypothetical protein pEaSNUABM10_00243 [Erwinia phage pEa_SNUABM_10]|nr:hypothetical protein pEaSNUABM10_00243 [Erwinia phage pEa_SNUABM_10]
MNTLSFEAGKGLSVNGHLVPDTNNHHFEKLYRRIGVGRKVNLKVTNEIALNGNVADLGPMYGFRPSQDAAAALLQHGEFSSGVYAFRLLGSLRRVSNKHVGQGMTPTVLQSGEIIVLVHSNHEHASGLDFMISYSEVESADV